MDRMGYTTRWYWLYDLYAPKGWTIMKSGDLVGLFFGAIFLGLVLTNYTATTSIIQSAGSNLNTLTQTLQGRGTSGGLQMPTAPTSPMSV